MAEESEIVKIEEDYVKRRWGIGDIVRFRTIKNPFQYAFLFVS